MAAVRLLVKAAMRSADLGHLADQIGRLEAGGVDTLHFDVMDGRFVPELCMGPSFIRGLRKYTRVPFEVHLLVQEPDDSWRPYADAGADGLLVHIESSLDPASTLAGIRRQRCQAGLAIAPETPAEAVVRHLAACDVVNVMTVAPGHPGVLEERGVHNLSELSEAARGRPILVQADGAVSAQTRERLVRAGAGAVVVGYPIFSQDVFAEAIAALRGDALINEPLKR